MKALRLSLFCCIVLFASALAANADIIQDMEGEWVAPFAMAMSGPDGKMQEESGLLHMQLDFEKNTMSSTMGTMGSNSMPFTVKSREENLVVIEIYGAAMHLELRKDGTLRSYDPRNPALYVDYTRMKKKMPDLIMP